MAKSGNSFGEQFKITTFGESHSEFIGVLIEGMPAGFLIDQDFIQEQLNRRRPGQSKVTTARDEKDRVEIISGVSDGKTTGAPILMTTQNQDVRKKDYDHLKNVFRPSHADFTYFHKYPHLKTTGGGRASARETWGRVAAGSLAMSYLKEKWGIEILAYVEKVGPINLPHDFQRDSLTFEDIEKSMVRCPHVETSQEMVKLLERAQEEKDSYGGVISCKIKNVPIGVGLPVYDRLDALLAYAMLSINATKGFEYGAGFEGTDHPASALNDEMGIDEKGKVIFHSNHSGGMLGGISRGDDINFRVAFKPVSSIGKKQKTVSESGEEVELEIKGRHDSCVLPRAVPIVESMAALVLLDLLLRDSI